MNRELFNTPFFFLPGLFAVFANLVANSAGSFASRLAGSRALAAATGSQSLVQHSLIYSLNMFSHHDTSHPTYSNSTLFYPVFTLIASGNTGMHPQLPGKSPCPCRFRLQAPFSAADRQSASADCGQAASASCGHLPVPSSCSSLASFRRTMSTLSRSAWIRSTGNPLESR